MKKVFAFMIALMFVMPLPVSAEAAPREEAMLGTESGACETEDTILCENVSDELITVVPGNFITGCPMLAELAVAIDDSNVRPYAREYNLVIHRVAGDRELGGTTVTLKAGTKFYVPVELTSLYLVQDMYWCTDAKRAKASDIEYEDGLLTGVMPRGNVEIFFSCRSAVCPVCIAPVRPIPPEPACSTPPVCPTIPVDPQVPVPTQELPEVADTVSP